MHHKLFPVQDNLITNTNGLNDLNFGLTEILKIGTEETQLQSISQTTTINVSSSAAYDVNLLDFSGSIYNSSINNVYATFVSGTVQTNQSGSSNVTVYSFTGYLTGSKNNTTSSFTGSLNSFSGSISGIFSGSVLGTFQTNGGYLNYFNGWVSNFTGELVSGSLNGQDILPQQNISIIDELYVNRSLVQFDLDWISQSISNGNINNPDFKLKMYVAREFNLPITYSIFAFPISESWVMGNGYLSDGGSIQGSSWLYRDYQNGTPWMMTGSTYISSSGCSQSFNYQVGDICMDISPIVYSWLSGSIQNNGLVLISSDEFEPTSSGMSLYFFSKETNTIYEPVLDVSWNDVSWITGSIITTSINISTIPAGLLGNISNNGPIINGPIYGHFSGVGNVNVGTSGSASGAISVFGKSGLILSMSIYGDFSGSTSSSIYPYTPKCQKCHPQFNAGFTPQPYYSETNSWPVGTGDFCWQGGRGAGGQYDDGTGGGQYQGQYQGHDIYGWGHPFAEFNQYDWWPYQYQQEFGPYFNSGSCCCGCGSTNITISFLMGTLQDGNFSGSIFTSSFYDGYKLTHGFLTGSFDQSLIVGTNISSSYPFLPFFPNAVNVSFSSSYIIGDAFGSILQLSASSAISNSGIFSGVFTDGIFRGYYIYAPFSGSFLTSSYFYTSSIDFTSSILSSVDTTQPFTTVIQNVPISIKGGDIVRINVFARPQFPLKNFERQTQFTQFLVPQYLPSSSYFAIKDNETEEVIVEFDQYTQLSCDSNGNYFIFDTTGFPQNRYFRILLRVDYDNGIQNTIDQNNIFKIIR